MKLKPFLGVVGQDESSVTVGLTDRYCIAVEKESNKEYWSRLDGAGLTINEEKYETVDSRTISYFSIFDKNPSSLLEKVRQLKVLVLGCGGLGSRLIIELSSLGVGTVVTTDPDILDETNLSRMPYFTKASLGEFKVELIESFVKKLDLPTKVIGLNVCGLEFCDKNNLDDFDFVFVTADGHFGNFLDSIGPILSRTMIPYLPTGYWESTLIVGPMAVGKDLSKLRTHKNVYKRDIIQRDFTPPSIGFANSIVVGVALNEMIKYFSATPMSLDLMQWQMDVFDLRSRLVRVSGFQL